MQAEAPPRKHALGRGNPKQLGAETVELHPFPGKAWAVSEFTSAFFGKLQTQEQALLYRHVEALGAVVIPDDLRHCLARNDASECGRGLSAATNLGISSQNSRGTEAPPTFQNSDAPRLIARRSGGRSAYWPERRLKFKGCRPVTDGTTYPLEVLRPGSTAIEHEAIPFGTMSAEGTVRELLGWAFCREHGLPVHAPPVCIYEYLLADGRSLGCCLVSETRGEDRIEAHIEYPACTVEELIRAKREGLPAINGTPIGSELRLRDVNLWWYVEEKSRLLCRTHFAGGFRGILNSNIGNDVLLPKANGGFELCLCDFDSFHVRAIPERPDRTFLEEFALWAMIEVIKGSLSICDYVEIPDEASAAEIAEELGRVYFAKSSLWRAYGRRFEQAAKSRGWDAEAVRAAFANARQTDALANVLASSVVNSHYLRQMSGNRAVFYPHN